MEGNAGPKGSTSFDDLRLQRELCDVVIRVGSLEMDAHKIILSSCSQYFRVLFSSRWAGVEKAVCEITNTSPEVMRLVVEYAYTESLPLTPDNAASLLAAADFFHIPGITRLCSQFLQGQLSPDNCVATWKLTDTCYCPSLREAAWLFILHHFQEMTERSAEFLELSAGDLEAIVEKDELNVKDESAAFSAVVKWVAHDPQRRRQHLALLLGKVRLALVQTDFLLETVRTHEYVKDSKECDVLTINALLQKYHLAMHGSAPAHPVTPPSWPRLPHTILFAIGGWSGESPTNAMESYDARADQWMNITSKDEGPLVYHGAAYLKGFIYVVGGFDTVAFLSSVKRFDLLRRTWQEVAPMHSRRCYVSVAVLNSNIYAMGGFDGTERLKTVERYEPDTNQWTLIAPMQEERSDSGAAVLHNKVYVCGGFNGNECLWSAEVYDATTNQWTFIAPMSSRRSGVGVMAYDNRVYAVGGFDGVNPLQTMEVYNPATRTWQDAPAMFTARSNFGVEVVDDLLFVVGGFDGFQTISAVECYNRAANEWLDAHDMGLHRSGLSCVGVPALGHVLDYAVRQRRPLES